MKIGIFDSGLGGLLITHSLIQALPDYDYLYYGDTARVPYGNRSQAVIYEFTRQAVDYLFVHGCGLVIIACNTASAEALRRLQQEYLPTHYPNRRILGVLIPAAEAAASHGRRIGVLATTGTITSGAFDREIHKLAPTVRITSSAAPLLVPLIENDGTQWAEPILRHYLTPLQAAGIDTLILGCTHYPFLRSQIEQIIGPDITVIAQTDLIPERLAWYLDQHPKLTATLSRHRTHTFHVTDLTPGIANLATTLFGGTITLNEAPAQP